MKKIIPVLAALLISVSGCMSVVKENPQTISKLNDQKNISWNTDNFPCEIENLNSKGEKNKQVFKKPPERVVAIWQNSIETLLALGVGDRIIAAIGVPDGKYISSPYREAYEKIAYKSFERIDLETIMMMNPDFIVGWNSTFSEKVLRSTDFWNSRGVHTYIAPSSNPKFPVKTIENEYRDILNMGKIFDKEDRAKELIGKMEKEINETVEKASKENRKPRGLIIEFLGNKINVYGSKTLAGDILQRLHGELLVKDQQLISKEQIIELNPDAIFVVITEFDYDNTDLVLDQLYREEALRDVPCIKEHHVYPLPLYSIYSSGTRTLEGIQKIKKGLYPDMN